jgi:hypothetical protein
VRPAPRARTEPGRQPPPAVRAPHRRRYVQQPRAGAGVVRRRRP